MAKINYSRAWEAAYNGDKLPRKAKKAILGKRITKKQLKAAVTKLQFDEHDELISEPFCPNCGCTANRGTGNMIEYPEHWEIFYCIRCNEKVGDIDNSRFVHVLEYEEYRALAN